MCQSISYVVKSATVYGAIAFISVISLFSAGPSIANASIFSIFSSVFGQTQDNQVLTDSTPNSQNMPVLYSSQQLASPSAIGGDDIIILDDDSLMAESGPSGTLADLPDTENNGQITRYTVQSGDTLQSIAKMFGVSVNTIIWANNINGHTVTRGQTLVILPVSGTLHTIAKGDTLQSVAKKYKADADEIAAYNGLDASSSLVVGDSIIIPDGEGAVITVGKTYDGHKVVFRSNPYKGGDGPDENSYYVRPLVGGVKTQGLHGWNAIDIGTPIGTKIFAAAAGQVIIARASGWNGGYGNYIAISHDNGTETVYGHLSKVFVQAGESVYQGQVIGLSGSTGNSTGPHLHFEVRGAHNFMGDADEY